MLIRTGAWLFIAAAATVLAMLGTPAETAAGGGGCRGRPSTEGTGTTVEMRENCFQPTVLHAEPGQGVTWTNSDPAPHSVAGATVEWGNYGTHAQGQSVSYTFDRPGTYPYYCFEHNGMIGAIVVGDGRGIGAAAAVRAATRPEPAATTAAPAPKLTRVETESGGNGVGWLPLGIVGVLGIVVGGGTGVALVRARR